MSRAYAALTPRARLRLARLIVEDGWAAQVATKMFMVSPVTARKWASRFRSEGPTGMADRSSRPWSMPAKTPPATVKRIVKARWRRRLGPVRSRSAASSDCRPRPSMRCWCDVGSTDSRRLTESWENRSAVTSTIIPAR